MGTDGTDISNSKFDVPSYYSRDGGESDGGSTPVQDEHEDFEGDDDDAPADREDVTVSPPQTPGGDEEEGVEQGQGDDWKGAMASDDEGDKGSDQEDHEPKSPAEEGAEEDGGESLQGDEGSNSDQEDYQPQSPVEEGAESPKDDEKDVSDQEDFQPQPPVEEGGESPGDEDGNNSEQEDNQPQSPVEERSISPTEEAEMGEAEGTIEEAQQASDDEGSEQMETGDRDSVKGDDDSGDERQDGDQQIEEGEREQEASPDGSQEVQEDTPMSPVSEDEEQGGGEEEDEEGEEARAEDTPLSPVTESPEQTGDQEQAGGSEDGDGGDGEKDTPASPVSQSLDQEEEKEEGEMEDGGAGVPEDDTPVSPTPLSPDSQSQQSQDRQSVDKEEGAEEESVHEGEEAEGVEETPVSPVSDINSPEQFDEGSRQEGEEGGAQEEGEVDEDSREAGEGDGKGSGDEAAAKTTGDAEMYEGAEQVSDAEEDDEGGPSKQTPGSPAEGPGGLDPVSDDEDDVAKPSKESGGEESDEEKELIADIFGSSDEEGEEFEGFGENELEPAAKKKKSAILSSDEEDNDEAPEPAAEHEEQDTTLAEATAPSKEGKDGSDSDEGIQPQKGYERADFVSDFDMMMERKKAEMGRRRKRKDVDIINDNDDIIMAMITQMKEAAEADQELNKQRKAAVKKLLMYPRVMQQLQKADLQQTLLECGILQAMKDWLMPLPDKSLPHLKIRSNFLKVLKSFPTIPQDLLKSSEVGKAVMILYRHPKELRVNKDIAGKIISNWSRPIFGVDDSFLAMSKEERQHRDLAQLSAVKRRRMSSQDERPRTIDGAFQSGEKALRPGDKGWIGRARVPMPSNKDYLVRPKSTVETEISASSIRKPPPSKLDKQMKKMKAYKARSKGGNLRAVNVSIAGGKMSL